MAHCYIHVLAYKCGLDDQHILSWQKEVCLPAALAGHHTSSWPADPGTEPSAGAAGSQRTGSSASPLDQL